MNEILDVTEEFIKKSNPGKGSVTYEEGFDFKHRKHEKVTALWLLDNFGGHILVLKEKMGYKIKNPDYKWNGKFWELKEVSSDNSLDNSIRKALEQIYDNPGGLIIDISKYNGNFNKLYSILNNRLFSKKIRKIFIILKKKNKLFKVYFKEK